MCSIDADIRYVWLNTSLNKDALKTARNSDFNFWMATAGLNFRF